MARKRAQAKATPHRRPAAPVEPRPLALDAHSVQVREEVDAALLEAQRLREDIERRIAWELLASSVFAAGV